MSTVDVSKSYFLVSKMCDVSTVDVSKSYVLISMVSLQKRCLFATWLMSPSLFERLETYHCWHINTIKPCGVLEENQPALTSYSRHAVLSPSYFDAPMMMISGRLCQALHCKHFLKSWMKDKTKSREYFGGLNRIKRCCFHRSGNTLLDMMVLKRRA